MTRTELLEAIVPAMANKQGSTYARALSAMEQVSTTELEDMYRKQVAAGLIKPPAPAPAVTRDYEEELLQANARTAAERAMHKYRMQEAREPQRAAQEKYDRGNFVLAAKKFGFATIEANFVLLRSVLGEGFSVEGVGYAVTGGQLSGLAAASSAELEQVRHEQEAENLKYLKTQASPAELRAVAQQQNVEHRAQMQREFQESQVQAREALDAQIGYPLLPATKENGEPLDSGFFKRLSNTDLVIFKNFVRKYGASAITRRLRNLG